MPYPNLCVVEVVGETAVPHLNLSVVVVGETAVPHLNLRVVVVGENGRSSSQFARKGGGGGNGRSLSQFVRECGGGKTAIDCNLEYRAQKRYTIYSGYM